MDPVLLTPFSFGNLTFKNRFVRSATNENMSARDGTPTEDIIRMYEELADNDVALIITGFSYVSERNAVSDEYQQGIWSDRMIPVCSRMTRAVHDRGAKIAVQLVHGGGQASPAGKLFVPTALGLQPEETELSPDMIREIEKDFIDAAVRAEKAGFDAVQLHLAHGFLLSSFISPFTNRRTDRYGGTTENRCRIITEIVAGISEKLGPDYPVFVKMNATDGFEYSGTAVPGDPAGRCYDMSNGCLDIEEACRVAVCLKDAGICAIEVSGGIGCARGSSIRKGIIPGKNEAYFRNEAKRIREASGLPVIAVGGFRSAKVINETVPDYADMIALSRPLLCEPDFVRKLIRGETDCSECTSCNACLYGEHSVCIRRRGQRSRSSGKTCQREMHEVKVAKMCLTKCVSQSVSHKNVSHKNVSHKSVFHRSVSHKKCVSQKVCLTKSVSHKKTDTQNKKKQPLSFSGQMLRFFILVLLS